MSASRLRRSSTSRCGRAARTRDLEQRRPKQAVTDLAALPLRRVPHMALLVRIWELRDNLSGYDAASVALAEALRAPLVTADRGIAGAPAVRCEVELVG